MLRDGDHGADVGPARSDAETNRSSFDRLLAHLKQAHAVEVRDLEMEVLALRSRLEDAMTACDGASKRPSAAGSCSRSSAVVEDRPPTPGSMHVKFGLEEDLDCDASDDDGAGEVAGTKESSASGPSRMMGAIRSVTEVATRREESLRRGFTESLSNRLKAKAEGRKNGRLWQLVRSDSFEAFFATMILFNAFVMAAEAQYVGFGLARSTGYIDTSRGSEEVWPHGKEVLDVVSILFGLLFCVEVALKIVGLRLCFFRSAWNCFDFVIVGMWLVTVLTRDIPVNVQMLRLARLARMLRFLRVIKLMRSQFAESMYLMSTALKNSFSILMWSCILLMVVHLMMALLMNQVLREWYFDARRDDQTKQAEVYYYFGSFSRSLLSMFEITLANWPPACRVLMDNVHEAFMIYALIHKMLLGFAVVGVINAVFIQETFRSAIADDSVMVAQTKEKQRVHRSRMNKLFAEADENFDNKIDLGEWQKVCEDEWVQVWLASQDLGTQEDAIGVFKMIDNGDGELSADELIKGVARLKGPCGNLQMMRAISGLSLEVRGLSDDLQRMMPPPPSPEAPVAAV